MTTFDAAGPDSEPVHSALPDAAKLFGEQERELRTLGAGAAKPICAVRVTPFKLAETVAV